jgi:hypothetical protein
VIVYIFFDACRVFCGTSSFTVQYLCATRKHPINKKYFSMTLSDTSIQPPSETHCLQQLLSDSISQHPWRSPAWVPGCEQAFDVLVGRFRSVLNTTPTSICANTRPPTIPRRRKSKPKPSTKSTTPTVVRCVGVSCNV